MMKEERKREGNRNLFCMSGTGTKISASTRTRLNIISMGVFLKGHSKGSRIFFSIQELLVREQEIEDGLLGSERILTEPSIKGKRSTIYPWTCHFQEIVAQGLLEGVS